MTRILVAGFQHETNTFAPSLAGWPAFLRGDGFPAYSRGAAMLEVFRGVNAPMGGFIDAARSAGWTLLPSCWAGATPSSYVTTEAFERIADAILTDTEAALAQGLDGIYLDLHGAAVAQNADDSEGELLARLRARVGPQLPIVASLDLHANVTPRMLALADALVSYRTYPHVDMAATGERAAQLLQRRLAQGHRDSAAAQGLPFLIPLNAQSTWMAPAQGLYEHLAALETRHGCMLSFCMGFPASDFDGCRPMVWGHGGDARMAVDRLFDAVAEPSQWALQVLDAPQAVARALELAGSSARPVVLADTQDNPGAGGDSNTTGMLHALLAQGAGRRHPGQVVLGMLYDEAAAARAHAVGVGGTFEGTVGTAVPTFTGQPSDAPVQGRFTVKALSDGVCTLKGPMMTGMRTGFGLSACLEIDGVQVAVVSGKAQLLDREMLRMVGVQPEAQRIIVVKSSNHFRADFTPIAAEVIVAKAAGPMAVDPGDLPWTKLAPDVRARPA
jgi:microcystin degradation protein MlrC